MPEPDPAAEWWTTSDVAAYLGVQIGTVSAYRCRGQMPAPTRTLGRTHLWRPLEIKAWRSPGADTVQPGDELPPLQPGEPWRRHGERTIYDSEWMRLDLVDIEQPGGSRFEHHVITMKPAVVVALLSEDRQQVLMLWRHRFVPDIWNWELPGGLVDARRPACPHGVRPVPDSRRRCRDVRLPGQQGNARGVHVGTGAPERTRTTQDHARPHRPRPDHPSDPPEDS